MTCVANLPETLCMSDKEVHTVARELLVICLILQLATCVRSYTIKNYVALHMHLAMYVHCIG